MTRGGATYDAGVHTGTARIQDVSVPVHVAEGS